MTRTSRNQWPASWWRDQCVTLLEANDWYGLYKMAMSWRDDGGAYTPEAWLMDVCSALLHRQPKNAVHCCDMALRTWIQRPGDRSVLHFVRGLLVADHVGDPLRALDDLERAAQGPAWLREDAQGELQRAQDAASRSRVRTPRVQPAPAYDPDYTQRISNGISWGPAMPESLAADGVRPEIWDRTLQQLRNR